MKKTLYTVGPVEMFPDTLETGGKQLPYFRNEEFSALTLACEKDILALTGAPAGSRALFLTCSGTGGMEAAIINVLDRDKKALYLRGGTFGERFGEICADVGMECDPVSLEPGKALPSGALEGTRLSDYDALLVNACETSTGVLYDLDDLGQACARSGILFVVDAISAFLCDRIDMGAMGIDVLILASQKALALAPGLSILVLSPRALERAAKARPGSHYFGLGRYLLDGLRGQTPFTPAVGTILQMRARLDVVVPLGAEALVRRAGTLARHFRESIGGLPFGLFADRPSNALSALCPQDGRSAYSIYQRLKDEYDLVVTPNGGALRDRVFRVGHMGNMTEAKLDLVAAALREVAR